MHLKFWSDIKQHQSRCLNALQSCLTWLWFILFLFVNDGVCVCVFCSLTDDHASCVPLESLTRPDVTQDSSEASSVEREPGPKKSRARERRREGRSKTFDWAEFRPIAQALAQQRANEAEALQAELSDSERSRRREERRRRYGSVVGSSPTESTGGMDFESTGGGSGGSGRLSEGSSSPPHQPQPVSLERQRKVEDEIEQHWQQVEKTPIREERRVPLASALQARETVELEKLLESYKKGVGAEWNQTPQ